MHFRRTLLPTLIVGLYFTFACVLHAQQKAPDSNVSAVPTPTPREDQEPVKVFTEEVRLPVTAKNENGKFDPSLTADDLIIFEDGVQQEIKSVTQMPASVLFLLATGGDMNPAIRVSTTREAALRLISTLRPGDNMAAIQFGARVEVIQAWTEDEKELTHALKTKLHSASGSRVAMAISAAAAFFNSQPFGNRHLVFITDGVEVPISRANYEEAMKILAAIGSAQSKVEWDDAVKRLVESQASVHVISYAEYGRLALKGKTKRFKGSNSPVGSVLASGIQTAGMDPTVPPNTNRGGFSDPVFGDGTNFDPAMRRLRKAYEKALKNSELRLISLADETGTRLVMPESAAEMISNAADVGRDIGSQYVVTYVPKRPLAEAKPGEYRKVQVASRQSGLTVRSRRGYIATH